MPLAGRWPSRGCGSERAALLPRPSCESRLLRYHGQEKNEYDRRFGWRRGGGCKALRRAGAQISPGDVRRPDRPVGDGDDAPQRLRVGTHRARLHADRRARRRQDDDGAHSRPRSQLRSSGLRQADDRHAGPRCPLQGHHGGPSSRRARNRRRLQYRRRQHPRDHRERAVHAAGGAHQGLHHRRSPHALEGRVQRAAEDARRAARARPLHFRDDGNPQSSGHRSVALPALRSAPRRAAGIGRTLSENRRRAKARVPTPTLCN